MPKYTTTNSIDIDELVRQSKANVPFVDEDTLRKAKAQSPVNPKTQPPQQANRAPEPEIKNDIPEMPKPQAAAPAMPGLILEDEEPAVEAPEKEYNGPGIVMSKDEFAKP